MFLCEQALQSFYGMGEQVFLDWHQTAIKYILKKKTDQ